MLHSSRIAAIPRIMKPTSKPTALSLMSISRPLRKYVFEENFMNSVAFSKHLALLVCAAVFALPTLLMAQAGSLDPTFGTNGIVTTANSGANAAALQSDGKIVVGGSIPANAQDDSARSAVVGHVYVDGKSGPQPQLAKDLMYDVPCEQLADALEPLVRYLPR